jgi:hypothetical protein
MVKLAVGRVATVGAAAVNATEAGAMAGAAATDIAIGWTGAEATE